MKGWKRALAILGVAVAASLFPSTARAGHGQVVDVLVDSNVYLPDEPSVCRELASALDKLTARLVEEGYPLKVAVIASRADIAGAEQYFDHPQEYARLVGNQIGFYRPGDARIQTNESLLVVMPAGFGFVRSGKAPNVFLTVLGLEAPDDDNPNDLARAAIDALRELASAAGHPVPAPRIDSECGDGGGSSAIVYILPIALALLAAGTIALAVRRRLRED